MHINNNQTYMDIFTPFQVYTSEHSFPLSHYCTHAPLSTHRCIYVFMLQTTTHTHTHSTLMIYCIYLPICCCLVWNNASARPAVISVTALWFLFISIFFLAPVLIQPLSSTLVQKKKESHTLKVTDLPQKKCEQKDQTEVQT